ARIARAGVALVAADRVLENGEHQQALAVEHAALAPELLEEPIGAEHVGLEETLQAAGVTEREDNGLRAASQGGGGHGPLPARQRPRRAPARRCRRPATAGRSGPDASGGRARDGRRCRPAPASCPGATALRAARGSGSEIAASPSRSSVPR